MTFGITRFNNLGLKAFTAPSACFFGHGAASGAFAGRTANKAFGCASHIVCSSVKSAFYLYIGGQCV